jgi:uncharacterized protein YgbK (DUF1537 family)
MKLSFSGIQTSLMPLARGNFLRKVQEIIREQNKIIVVPDDDPTGNQTVHGAPILTDWEYASLEGEIKQKTPLFFILTNSRSLPEKKAIDIARDIGQKIKKLSEKHGVKIEMISRGDSTLRGHFPAEPEALARGLAWKKPVIVLVPAFFEGGRYTYQNIHYVKEGNTLIPAAETPFSNDPAFGYQSSNLVDWAIEKSGGRVTRESISAISIEDIREKNAEKARQKIQAATPGSCLVINAMDRGDLDAVSLLFHEASQDKRQFLFRTSASFVASFAGLPGKELLVAKNLSIKKEKAGLVIIGSHVPKTTAQLQFLQAALPHLQYQEISVKKLLHEREKTIRESVKKANQSMKQGKHVVLFTSRERVEENDKNKGLDTGQKVSSVLTSIVKQLEEAPGFLLAKGGITSSVIATEGLEVKRAIVQGQIAMGVPVWQTGPESRFPGMPYIVFPGNVGNEKTLLEVVKKLIYL